MGSDVEGGSRRGGDGVFVVLPELPGPARPGPDSARRGCPVDREVGAPGSRAGGAGPVVLSEVDLDGAAALPGTGLVLAASIAARTPGREVGACVALPGSLPEVLRLAEETATADGVCRGRLHLVLAERPDEPEAPLTAEASLALLRRALAGGPVPTPGGEVPVHPRPARPSGPRLWLLGGAPGRARALGLGHLAPAPPGAPVPAGGALRLRLVGSAQGLWLVGLDPPAPPPGRPSPPPASARPAGRGTP